MTNSYLNFLLLAVTDALVYMIIIVLLPAGLMAILRIKVMANIQVFLEKELEKNPFGKTIYKLDSLH